MATTEDVTRLMLSLAQRTPINIAPEKAQALAKEVFGTEKWELRDSRTEANFYAVVPDRAVYASYAGLASLWCLSFVAFCVMDLSSRAARSVEFKGEQIDIGAHWASMNLQAYLDYARRLFHADEAWPENMCEPKPGADLDSIEGRINNLFFGALSWILLHEIAHVHHGHSNLIPASMKVGQEYQADAFATMWVLDDAGNGLQREFRVLAVSVALAWLFLHEQAKGQGSDHPAAILRFRDAVAHFNMGARSPGLENATYMLKAIFDPGTEMPTRMMAHEVFDWMCKRLEVIFSGRH
ncbi:MAG: phage exclusion protein Lit family protein [Pseudomonadota bacterium]|nr:phage exclusion protein Lit family protein [Pseudomonadota bacterium]